MVCAAMNVHPFTPFSPGMLGFDVTSMTIFNVTGAATLRVLDTVTTGDPSAQVSNTI